MQASDHTAPNANVTFMDGVHSRKIQVSRLMLAVQLVQDGTLMTLAARQGSVA